MRIAIHQPEHFPYMGFFQKMASVDLFIILDDVKFRKNYFQNRNKIKSVSGRDEWITVPVSKDAPSFLIRDVVCSESPNWRKKIIKQIHQNFKFDATGIYDHTKLIDINMASIDWARHELGIETRMAFSSEFEAPGTKTERLVNLVRSVGGTSYVSGQGARDYLDEALFEEIKVEFFKPNVENHYSCLYNLTQGVNERWKRQL
tara:strand:+ start:10621 stop:11229 length:609 start_codon:yes stop_codon:yes gene_type:complete